MGAFAGMVYRQLMVKPKPLPVSVRLDGKTVLITGGNAGLGLEAAKELASHGLARLILAVRSEDKGRAAAAKIAAVAPKVVVEVWLLDHESFASIDAFGSRADGLDRLDIAILNVGIKNLDYASSPTGHEAHLQVNHLGTALVSLHLLGVLGRTAARLGQPGRLTVVASENHFWVKFRELGAAAAAGRTVLSELDSNRACFSGPERGNTERYNTSKLLNVLWARELSDRAARAAGVDVVVNAVNPGFCVSGLHAGDPQATKALGLLAYTAEQGGRCLSDAATRHAESRGAYLSEQTVKKPSPFVLSPAGRAAQAKIWKETVELFRREAPAVTMLERLDSA